MAQVGGGVKIYNPRKGPHYRYRVKRGSSKDMALKGLWLTLLSFRHHLGIYVEGFTLFDSHKVWVFDGHFCFQYHYI